MKRYLAPLILGISGCAILISLGVWQLQRLAWKEAILAEMEARIAGDPIALPETPTLEDHRFAPVTVTGDFTGDDIPVFLSHDSGPIYRLVAVLETDTGRRIMVDRGGIPGRSDPDPTRRTGPMIAVEITGNLHWPDEVDSWTPDPDARGVYFGRDIPAMAAELGTEPVLVVASEVSQNTPQATPLKVTTEAIANNHLAYAIQWFGLAIVWAGMTLYMLRRRAKQAE